MKAAGMTDPRLAELAGTTKQQIFKLRRGERKLTVQWAQRLASHLDTVWFDLIAGERPSPDLPRVELLAAYDAMSSDQRHALVALVRTMVTQEALEKRIVDPIQRRRSAPCLVPDSRMRGR